MEIEILAGIGWGETCEEVNVWIEMRNERLLCRNMQSAETTHKTLEREESIMNIIQMNLLRGPGVGDGKTLDAVGKDRTKETGIRLGEPGRFEEDLAFRMCFCLFLSRSY